MKKRLSCLVVLLVVVGGAAVANPSIVQLSDNGSALPLQGYLGAGKTTIVFYHDPG